MCGSDISTRCRLKDPMRLCISQSFTCACLHSVPVSLVAATCTRARMRFVLCLYVSVEFVCVCVCVCVACVLCVSCRCVFVLMCIFSTIQSKLLQVR